MYHKTYSMKHQNKKRKKLFHGRGFTLVELLVVIAIIGLLTAMVVISIQHVKAKSRDAQRVSDINSIATALALYHNDYNAYPIYDASNGYPNGIRITGDDSFSQDLENAGTIRGAPIDPLDQSSTDCGSLPGYYYYYESDGSDYILEYCLETNSIQGKSTGYNYFVP